MQGDGLAALRFNEARGALGRLQVDVGHGHRRALACQRQSTSRAYAAAAARHQSGLTLYPSLHCIHESSPLAV
jgi:hypothetical protein